MMNLTRGEIAGSVPGRYWATPVNDDGEDIGDEVECTPLLQHAHSGLYSPRCEFKLIADTKYRFRAEANAGWRIERWHRMAYTTGNYGYTQSYQEFKDSCEDFIEGGCIVKLSYPTSNLYINPVLPYAVFIPEGNYESYTDITTAIMVRPKAINYSVSGAGGACSFINGQYQAFAGNIVGSGFTGEVIENVVGTYVVIANIDVLNISATHNVGDWGRHVSIFSASSMSLPPLGPTSRQLQVLVESAEIAKRHNSQVNIIGPNMIDRFPKDLSSLRSYAHTFAWGPRPFAPSYAPSCAPPTLIEGQPN